MKKLFSLFLLLAASVGMMQAAIINGTCGENLTWSLNTKDSTLTIEGSGEMTSAPWDEHKSYIAYVSLPDGLTSIGNSAFYNCTGLTSVEIPNSVTSIGNSAFSSCTGLISVTIGNSVTSIGDYAFSSCTGLTSMTIPNSVTSIGGRAFSDCTGLTSVTIGNSVTSIGDEAFYNCTGLTSVTIGNSVTSIGSYAFRECTSLTSVTIPNSVTNIGRYAFEHCTGLASIEIPNSVTKIRPCTFLDCKGLTSVTIPNSVTSIGNSAFDGCTSLTSVTIPNSVTSIERYAFSYCTGLTSVEIPNSVTTIEYGAFCGCKSLTSIEIPNSVTTIEDAPESYSRIYGVFSECSSLTSVTIPNSVISIGSYAFHNCTSLTSVNIPNSVTSIGKGSFSGCNLSSITCEATTPPAISNNTFSSYSAILFVPAESIETYQNTLYWEDFTDIRAIGSAPLVQFLDWNGTILSSANVTIGTAATPPAAPTRTGYTFTGWDKDFSNITEDLTVTALYNINRYEVKFVDWDGTILKSYIVDWNTAAVAPANPSREGYTFIGWDKEFSNVVANLIITAQYDFGENKNYTINFNTKDGDEILSNNIVLKVPAAPQIDGFTFIGWRPVSDIIESNTIEIEAVYESDDPTSAPAVVTNPSNPAQKLIRNGNVYILTGDRIYTVTGQQVK